MHTSSYDSMRASPRRLSACDASHERYCECISQSALWEERVYMLLCTPWLRLVKITAPPECQCLPCTVLDEVLGCKSSHTD
jgi:hypothetical protein